MAFLIAIELLVLSFVMETLSSVRILISAEGKWSKAQKDAIISLQDFIITSDISNFNKFQKYLKVPIGYRNARIEIDKPEPTIELIYAALSQGQIHRDDIKNVVHLLRRFKNAKFIKESVKDWQQGDMLINELLDFANQIQKKISENSKINIKASIERVNDINSEMTKLEEHFSTTLRVGARRVEQIFWIMLLILVLTVEVSGLTFIFNFSKHLSHGLNELNRVAVRVGEGDFDHYVDIKTQDELGRLANAINKMVRSLKTNISYRIKAENQNRAKDLFLANMSHEIRTPLGAILGFSELLQQENLTQDERIQYQKIIKNSGQNLTNIITDILDISRIESGHLTIKNVPFNLNQLLEDIQNLYTLKCNERGIKLEILKYHDFTFNILSDPARIKQIITNLLNNSIKFTPSKGIISIEASLINKKLIFDIKDTGIGIKKKDWSKIFEPYVQSDNKYNPQVIGTGLGLAISKHLAQALGGDLTLVSSQEGQGSHFKVEILYVVSEEEIVNVNEIENKKINLKGARILVVEDGDVSRLLVKTLLEKRGCLVEIAENGIDAVKVASQKKFDVILMDIQMPMMDGYTATQRLREMKLSTPIIALTAHSMKEDEKRCLESGFNDYLSKPIHTEDLFIKIYKNIS